MEIVIKELSFLFQGAYYTLLITLVSMFFGFILATFLSMMRSSNIKILKKFVKVYVSFFRGTPLLVQIFIIYYGLSDYQIKFEPIQAAFLALSLNSAAFISQTLTSALNAVAQEQLEAGLALGFNKIDIFIYILFPQAIKIAIGPLGNTFIGMLKETSLVSVITVTELLRASQLLIAKYFLVMPFYIAIGIMYWIMSISFQFILEKIEKNLDFQN